MLNVIEVSLFKLPECIKVFSANMYVDNLYIGTGINDFTNSNLKLDCSD